MALSRGQKKQKRSAIYEALKSVLEVDAELDTISIRKKLGS